ncbi:MAG TPA: hypothetical protein VG982_00985 [Candidatus Paceibacterota bacterium]|jgi:hypothetical protein|nr:hypothetical protein [Candidatus Paceibacterota bacterium]
MQPTVSQPVFLNVEYLFFLIFRAVKNFVVAVFSLKFLELLRVAATVIVIILIAFILFMLVRLYEIKREAKAKEKAKLKSTPPRFGTTAQAPLSAEQPPSRNDVWEHIRGELLSDNPSDWRLGIIEADIYLDHLLDEKGFLGQTTGDKLKQVTESALASINLAWEAHKVRNRIAHDGASFVITQPEVRRVLSYYEIVFRDFGAIE